MRVPTQLRWILPAAFVVAAGVIGFSRENPELRAAPGTPSPASSVAVTAEPPETPRTDERDCAGVFYPIELTIDPAGQAVAGEIALATIRVRTRRPIGALEIRYLPSPGLTWLSVPYEAIERLSPGQELVRDVTVRLPAGLARRIVEVKVRGWIDGYPMERSAVWNLDPRGPEPSLEVIRPDGSRVREVAARRIR
jgi:hypothetical protein